MVIVVVFQLFRLYMFLLPRCYRVHTRPAISASYRICRQLFMLAFRSI